MNAVAVARLARNCPVTIGRRIVRGWWKSLKRATPLKMSERTSMTEPASDQHAHPARTGMRYALLGILANAALTLIKGAAGFLGNSYALIADATESAFDIF